MDFAEMEHAIAKFDRALRPIAKRQVDISGPDWGQKLHTFVQKARSAPPPLEEAGIKAEAETLLETVLAAYAGGDEAMRVAIRGLFERYTSFRWASTLSCPPTTAEGFRRHVLLLSARDQGSDPRDEILALQYLCAEAKKNGVEIAPILNEIAELSSDVNKYGMGSLRSFLRNAC
jgi:hypothetical protein